MNRTTHLTEQEIERLWQLREKFNGQQQWQDDLLQRDERQVLYIWERPLRAIGIGVFGIGNVPRSNFRLSDNKGNPYIFSPMNDTTIYQVPQEVYNRHLRAKDLQVPTLYWFIGKEAKPGTPEAMGIVMPQSRIARTVPLECPTLKVMPTPMRRVREKIHLDPVIFAVIPTSDYRGLFTCLGRWLHQGETQ